MKELVRNEFNLSDLLINKIVSIEDNSDSLLKRLRIVFKNGYGMSIIKGKYAYCGKDTYEIAPINKEGGLQGSLLKINFDDVLGYQTKQDIFEHMTILSNI